MLRDVYPRVPIELNENASVRPTYGRHLYLRMANLIFGQKCSRVYVTNSEAYSSSG